MVVELFKGREEALTVPSRDTLWFGACRVMVMVVVCLLVSLPSFVEMAVCMLTYVGNALITAAQNNVNVL
jgi:hypothetical protein